MTPRRYLLVGLAAVYLVAAVFAIRWQIRERSWDPAIEPYVAFVEAERGLRFRHPVDVRFADIAAELEADFAAQRDDDSGTDPYQEAYALLGLIDQDPETRFDERIEDTATEQAGAFYDPVIEEIVLPADADPAALGFTIVHELTHALQHQNGMLDWFLESPDAAATRTTLVEGDAERIALAWFEQLSETERERFLVAIDAGATDLERGDPGNTFFETSFAASYALGLPMVQTLVETGGQREIDRLLRSEDAGTSERLVDALTPSPTTDRFIEPPDDIDHPDGDVGAVTWFQAIAPTIGTRAALDALIGFDGDAFAMRNGDDIGCAWFGVSFDSAGDADEFSDAVRSLPAIEQDDVRSPEPAIVEIDVCVPLGNPNDQRFGTIMPLVVAQEMTLVHVSNGVASELARCAGLAQAATIPADQPFDAFVGWAVVEAEASSFVDDCSSAVFSQD